MGLRCKERLCHMITSIVEHAREPDTCLGQAQVTRKTFALFGGVMIGIGAAFAGGCVVGNIMSGWALMSVGMFLFGIVTVLSNWAATYVYMMGSQSSR